MRRRREDAADVPIEIATAPTQHGIAERGELRERLLCLLDGLADDQRNVFVLFEIEGLSMAEVAAALHCPLQTAYARLHAARARLQAAVGADKEDCS